MVLINPERKCCFSARHIPPCLLLIMLLLLLLLAAFAAAFVCVCVLCHFISAIISGFDGSGRLESGRSQHFLQLLLYTTLEGRL